MKSHRIALAIFCLITASIPASAMAFFETDAGDIPRDELVYVMADQGESVQASRVLALLPGAERAPALDVEPLRVTAYWTRGSRSVIDHEIEAVPGVLHAWREHVWSLPSGEARPRWTGGPETPQDEPYWSKQWDLEAAYLPDAWGVGTGDGVTVAVIDTGVQCSHPDASCSTRLPHYDAITRRPVTNPVDVFGHATHVAGTIAARFNGIGIGGGAPDADILSCRACDANGRCAEMDVAACVVYSAPYAQVLNMSLGGGATSQTPALCQAIENATAAGTLSVASVGNNGPSSSKMYPAGCAGVIGVAASEPPQGEKLASYSQRSNVDITAPGSEVLSAYPPSRWAFLSGTSMAAPHVSAAAAILAEVMGTQWSPAAAEKLLEDNAFPLCGPSVDPRSCGHGGLDANAAVRAFLPQPVVPTPPTATITPTLGAETLTPTPTQTPASTATSAQHPAVQTALARLTQTAAIPTLTTIPTLSSPPSQEPPQQTQAPVPTWTRTPTPAVTVDRIGTAVAATLTARAPTPTVDVEATLTALAPTPDRIGTAVAATLEAPGEATRRAEARLVVWMPALLAMRPAGPPPACGNPEGFACAWATIYAERTATAVAATATAAAAPPGPTRSWPLRLEPR